MNLKTSKKFTAVLTSVLATFAVYTGALVIFLYVQGWRIDFLDQSIKQVGVLTVESSPTQANIYIDDKNIGKTNKSTTLDVGTYDIRVAREGYYDWNKEVKILEEKSTPVFPYLIRTEFQEETIYTSELALEKHWADKYNNHLIMLFKEENVFQLVHYNINSGFWTLNTSPVTILSIEDNIENPITDIDLQLSPSGERAILRVITDKYDSKYVIPTTRLSQYSSLVQSPLSLSDFTNYTTTWSKDEKFLMLESQAEVVSYDLERNTKHLLFKKTDPLDIWTTDEEGFFYLFRHNSSDTEEILTYTLNQYNLDGSAKTVVIPAAYFQNNTDYIEKYRTTDFDFGFFTNSPENTQTIGEITDFVVNQNVNGIYIKTTQASYWYNTTTGKYITASPFPADILYFSPDQDKALIKNNSSYNNFVFDKEEGDHTITIGTHPIDNLNFDQIQKINWLSNSSYIQFEEDDFIYISDIDGDNKTPIMSTENILYWTVTSSRDNLVTLGETEENGIEIKSYTIH